MAEFPPIREKVLNRFRVRKVPLGRLLLGGEGGLDAGQWAELSMDESRASTLLADSPHVQFLQRYRQLGEEVFRWEEFERTAYCQNALACIRHLGHYFGQTTPEGIRAQAQAFASLYDRQVRREPTEVRFPCREGHSSPGSLPVVHRTWTPGTFRVLDGAHRLAVGVAARQEEAKAIVLPPRPTDLQRLVMSVRQTAGRRELYQPIDGVEFDGSWTLIRRCQDRFGMMRQFLAEHGHPPDSLSVLDLACSYGWFVAEFARAGSHATGVDPDSTALRIGRIAYGLKGSQLVQSDLLTYLGQCQARCDVVLLLSILHHFVLTPSLGSAAEVLQRVDAITGSVLFLDTGQAHEEWFASRLPEWRDDFIIAFIRKHTSFDHVLALGVDSDNASPYQHNYRRTLFAAFRTA